MVKQKEDPKYTELINTKFPKEVVAALKRYCDDEGGIKAPVVVRKAVVKYLKEKNYLEENKKYL